MLLPTASWAVARSRSPAAADPYLRSHAQWFGMVISSYTFDPQYFSFLDITSFSAGLWTSSGLEQPCPGELYCFYMISEISASLSGGLFQLTNTDHKCPDLSSIFQSLDSLHKMLQWAFMAANLAFVDISLFRHAVDPPYLQVPHLWNSATFSTKSLYWKCADFLLNIT